MQAYFSEGGRHILPLLALVTSTQQFMEKVLESALAKESAAAVKAEKEGKDKIKKQASWKQMDYLEAGANLLESQNELFKVNWLGLTEPLLNWLVKTKLIENPDFDVGNVKHRVRQ